MQAFFANVAKARTVKAILQQCYGDKSTVTDELVQYVNTFAIKLLVVSPIDNRFHDLLPGVVVDCGIQ